MNENVNAGADINAGDGGYSLGTQEEYNEFANQRNRMSGRIRDIERASGLEIYGLGAKRDMWEATLEKFAGLIVKECAVAFHQTRLVDTPIEHHFRRRLGLPNKGVKE